MGYPESRFQAVILACHVMRALESYAVMKTCLAEWTPANAAVVIHATVCSNAVPAVC